MSLGMAGPQMGDKDKQVQTWGENQCSPPVLNPGTPRMMVGDSPCFGELPV